MQPQPKLPERLFTISRTVEIDSKTYESREVVVQAANLYNAFQRFSQAAGLPQYADCTEIGEIHNPCVRYILPDSTRFYVTIYFPEKNVADEKA